LTVLDEQLRERLSEYTSALFAPEDSVLADLGKRTRSSDEAPMQVSAEVGKLLYVLASAVSARRILEVGTLFGYSAIWMARALPPDGELLTLELNAERAAEAESWIARARLSERVRIVVGPALQTLRRLPRDAPFDFTFLDAAKEEYPQYLEHALELVRPGGIITADNALLAGSQEGTVADEELRTPGLEGVREYNRRIARDPRLASTIVPVREGVAISVVRSAA
jgi:predicted O-methyltransferase YrrM